MGKVIINDSGTGYILETQLSSTRHTTYLGRQVDFAQNAAREVAPRVYIKVFRAEMRSYFNNEREALSRLNHDACPGIIAPIDSFVREDRGWLVFPYVEGQNLLTAIVSRKHRSLPRLSMKRVSKTLVEVCATLEQSHSIGIKHGDVKPDNAHIDRDGVAHLIDWELGWHESFDNKHYMKPDVIIGTLAYMAPERMHPKIPPSIYTDIYSLGALAYHALTGNIPFHGSERSVMDAIMNEMPQRPSKLRRNIPAQLDAVILKALSKVPWCRQTSAQEFCQEFTDAAKPRCFFSMFVPVHA